MKLKPVILALVGFKHEHIHVQTKKNETLQFSSSTSISSSTGLLFAATLCF